MRRRIASRAALFLAAFALSPPTPGWASADPSNDRIFTIAGGGTTTPAEGVVATDARLAIRQIAALDGGGAVLVHEGREVYRVGWDGILRRIAIPEVLITENFTNATRPASVTDLDARADGTLVLALADRVWELRVGADGWEPLAAFAGGTVDGVLIDSVAAVPEGGTLAVGASRAEGDTHAFVWRFGTDGHIAERYGPIDDAYFASGIVSLPGGAFAFNDSGETGAVIRRDRAGAIQRLARGYTDAEDLAALPDGSLLRPDGRLTHIAPSGRRSSVRRYGVELGMGDGGRAGLAAMDAKLVDARADGAWLVADNAPADPLLPFDHHAWRSMTGHLVTLQYERSVPSHLRFAGGRDPGVPVVSLLPGTYRGLKRGGFAYYSSFGGTGTLIVRSRRQIVTEVSFPANVGTGMGQLPTSLPAGDYRLELRVTNGARVAVHRLAVSLTPRLTRERALRLARSIGNTLGGGGDAGGGSLGEASRCRRVSARQFRCAGLRIDYEGDDFTPHCVGVIRVRLRRDGARGYFTPGWRKCRQLVPRAALEPF